MSVIISGEIVLSAVGGADAPLIGYHTILPNATITATSEADGHPITLATNVSTAEFWKATGTADQVIEIETNSSDDLDYIGIARHNLGTAGATITVEGATELDAYDDPDYFDLDVDVIPGDDCALLLRFEKQALLFVRITIENPSVAPEIGVLYLGALLPMQRNLYVGHSPASLNRNTTIATGVAEAGTFLGLIEARHMLRTDVKFDNVTPSWYRSTFKPFADVSRTTPFFWAWRPTSYPDEVVFCWMASDVAVTNSLPNGFMSFEFSVEGVSCG